MKVRTRVIGRSKRESHRQVRKWDQSEDQSVKERIKAEKSLAKNLLPSHDLFVHLFRQLELSLHLFASSFLTLLSLFLFVQGMQPGTWMGPTSKCSWRGHVRADIKVLLGQDE